jgi:LPXTG-site transpeptidase (sortase) family protein
VKLPSFNFIEGAPRAGLIVGIPIVAFILTVIVTLATSSGSSSHASPPPTLAVQVAQSQPLPTETPAPPTPVPAVEQSYTVQGGDRLSAIAAQFGVSVDSIVQLNGLRDANAISIGQVLRIPAPTATPKPAAATASTSSAANAASSSAAATSSGAPTVSGSGDRLVMSRLAINAPVTINRVGTDGVMGNPLGPTDVVWYDFSALAGYGGYPGQGGNAVFAGHVDYHNYGTAVFWNLKDVQQGDLVEYYTADGKYYKYSVQWVSDVSPDADFGEFVTASAGDVMTLITCVGEFNPATRHYDHRRVVRASRVA